MKLIKPAALGAVMVMSTNVNAAAIATADISLDWNSLTFSSNIMTPATIVSPAGLGGGTSSGSTDGEIYYPSGGTSGHDQASSPNSDPMSVSFSSTATNVSASYDPSPNQSAVNININNTGDLFQDAIGRSSRNQYFTATGSGFVTFSVDYTMTGSSSVTGGPGVSEFVNGDFSYLIEALNADTFLTTFNSEYSTNGNDATAASAAAASAAFIGGNEQSLGTFNSFSGCSVGVDCFSNLSGSGTLTFGFDVLAGTTYALGAEVDANISTKVSPVPVPAAFWLFGSGLISLVTVSRRKTSSIN